jgi:hypothetical protein
MSVQQPASSLFGAFSAADLMSTGLGRSPGRRSCYWHQQPISINVAPSFPLGPKKFTMRPSTSVVFLFIASLFLTACGNDPGFVEPVSVPTGYVRVVNAIPDSVALSPAIDKRIQTQPVNFGDNTSIFNILPTLNRPFDVVYAEDGQSKTLISQNLTVDINHEVTMVLAGTMASPRILAIDNPPATFVSTDNFAELQLVHAANNYSAEVGFMLVSNADFSTATTVLLGQFSESLLLRPTATTDFEIIAVSTLPATGGVPADADILWRSGSFDLPAISRPMLILEDYFGPGGKGVRAGLIGSTGTQFVPTENLPAAIRIANTMPDVGPIDIYLNDQLISSNPTYGVVGAYAEIDVTGVVNIKVTPVGDPATVLLERAPTVTRGRFHTLDLTGIAASSTLGLGMFVDDNRAVPSRMVISGIHSSPNSGALDFYLVAPGTSIADTRAVSLNTTLLVPTSFIVAPGSYDLVIAEAGTTTVVVGPQPVTLSNNAIYRFYVIDAVGGGLPATLILADDFTTGS